MNLKICLAFLGGSAIGALSTYFCMKDKCEKLIEEETYNIKKYYEEKNSEKVEEPKNEEKKEDKPLMTGQFSVVKDKEEEPGPDYEEIIQKLNYNEFSTKTTNQKAKRPYIITADEYTDANGYIKKIISYFEDDEVCMDNETKEVLDNVAKDIGNDCLERINEDGENEIYVRNEILGIDYNIVSEAGSYEDFLDE